MNREEKRAERGKRKEEVGITEGEEGRGGGGCGYMIRL